METFETALAAFEKFLIQQGYPPEILWVAADGIALWRSRIYIWKGTPSKRLGRAKATFEGAIARKMGVMLQAVFKTEELAVCRVYVPPDQLDAERRMIPTEGIKLNATVDPRPATPVGSLVCWQIVRLFGKTLPSGF